MGTSPCSSAHLVSASSLWGVVAYFGLPQRQTPTVLRHVFPAESSGARIDASFGPTERSGLDTENCRTGLQYRGRSLFNSLGYPLGTAGLKSAPQCRGYFEGSTEFRRESHLHSRYLAVGRCFDF